MAGNLAAPTLSSILLSDGSEHGDRDRDRGRAGAVAMVVAVIRGGAGALAIVLVWSALMLSTSIPHRVYTRQRGSPNTCGGHVEQRWATRESS